MEREVLLDLNLYLICIWPTSCNLSSTNLASQTASLNSGQLLLIPGMCYCNGARYFSNVTYKIKKDDSYFLEITTLLEVHYSNKNKSLFRASLNKDLQKAQSMQMGVCSTKR
ncbi:hypothetical protein SAY87_017190 [Trapa incisa]|uniref:Uncharacterized protein n=1 Tax=Trapa incisa TaxID=236973 RepID=A0AAN7QV50_9MYRT|nr:hypothetical protein SAY87_017190 [Trapa incisa]